MVKGNVIGFDADTHTGAISGHDGNRYDFVTQDWHGGGTPRHGDLVDFSPAGSRASDIYLLEAEYVPLTVGQFYFSLNGRISRKQFWLRWTLPVAVIGAVLWGIVAAITAVLSEGTTEQKIAIVIGVSVVYGLIFWLATLWPDIAVLAKRIHDRNKSGWFVLACLIPRFLSLVPLSVISTTASFIGLVVFIWFFVEFGCLRGTIGANRHGPDPVPH